MWIQIILFAGIIAIGALLGRVLPSDSHLALRRLLLIAVLAVAIVMILVPQWLTAIANLLGIGRGADLVLYALVIAFGAYVATEYRRNVRVSRQLTNLTRELALAEARANDAAQRDGNTNGGTSGLV